jgi:CBS domain containing-hemolysin-like protein
MSLTLAVFGIIAIVILTAISAFFSSSELAVFSVASHRIDAIVDEGRPGGDALAALRSNPHRFLVTALVSNNIANIAAASVATAVLVQFLPAGQAATASTVVTSFFVIVFGEIAPKSYAVANAERHALRVARPVVVIQRLLRPLLYIFEATTGVVNRLTGGDTGFESYLSREEIEGIVRSGEATGVLDTEEGAMIRSVLDLETTIVQAVMVPRTRIISVPETASLDTVIETCWGKGVDRVPVVGESRDDVRGIVDLRGALAARAEGGSLEAILTDPVFVPTTKPVDELLAEMQRDGHRMVVVVDEFGTVVGLATLEDVIEEVVGELVDHTETDPVRIVDDGSAIAAGWAAVGSVNDSLGIELPTAGSFETIAGLLSHQLGRLPRSDDRVELGGVVLTVVEAGQTRVQRVRIEWEPKADDAAAVTASDDQPEPDNGSRDDDSHDD